jgi:nucleotide-binding universal stress UspA family protein
MHMPEEIIACLDGSPPAEAILPLAQGIASAIGADLSLLRILADSKSLPDEESYTGYLAGLFGGQAKFIIAPEPAAAIIEVLRNNPRAMVAMTTHGRTAWMEAVIGTVALEVVRGAGRPVLIYGPTAIASASARRIETIIIALDGSAFSEKIIPFVVDFAKSIQAEISLAQAVPFSSQEAAAGLPQTEISESSSYLQSVAAEIKKKYSIEPNWHTLHGEPGQALCRFVHGMPNTMLAFTTHARAGLERAFLGSIAATCLRHANVPILLYWPDGSH